jgi:hypothetical protein
MRRSPQGRASATQRVSSQPFEPMTETGRARAAMSLASGGLLARWIRGVLADQRDDRRARAKRVVQIGRARCSRPGPEVKQGSDAGVLRHAAIAVSGAPAATPSNRAQDRADVRRRHRALRPGASQRCRGWRSRPERLRAAASSSNLCAAFMAWCSSCSVAKARFDQPARARRHGHQREAPRRAPSRASGRSSA